MRLERINNGEDRLSTPVARSYDKSTPRANVHFATMCSAHWHQLYTLGLQHIQQTQPVIPSALHGLVLNFTYVTLFRNEENRMGLGAKTEAKFRTFYPL